MEKAKANFQNAFYNLEGIHYKERKRNFYKLLHSTDLQVFSELNIETDLQPRNYLEKIFYVEVLIKAKKVNKLIEILKEGMAVLTSKIIKHKWFFTEAFKDMSEAVIVNEFLPTLSFSLRMKILKKIVLVFNEERNNQMFDSIFEKYGLFIAQQFLFSCSCTKIKEILQNHKITLSIEQLKRILPKDHNLIKIYFDEYKKNNGKDFDDNEFLSYIIWKYPQLYSEFKSYFVYQVKIGRQTTKTLLKIDKDEVFENIEKLPDRFHVGVITRQIKDFDKDYLYKYFPKNMKDIDNSKYRTKIEKFLTKYPIKNRWNTFSKAFQMAYNAEVLENLEVVTEKIIIMGPVEAKQKWAAIKYKEGGDTTFLKYFKPTEAVALLKEKINVTSNVTKRVEFVRDMLTVCGVNKDYKTFEEVLKYICSRHRNEDTFSRQRFFFTIKDHVDYELCTEGFWKYTNELVELCRAKGEELPYRNMAQYITFVIKKNMPYEKLVEQFFKDPLKEKYIGNLSLTCFYEHHQVQRVVMTHMATKLAPNLEAEQRKRVAAILIQEISDFNMRHKDLWVDLNEIPIFGEYLKEIISKNDVSNDDIIFIEKLILNNYGDYREKPLKDYGEESQLINVVKAICTDENKGWIYSLLDSLLIALKPPRTTYFQTKLLDCVFNDILIHCDTYNQLRIFKQFIKNEPKIISNFFDSILKIEIKDRSIIDYSTLKLYSHLNLDTILINRVKHFVQVKSTCEKKTYYIENLSNLMETQDYINLITDYIPTKVKLDLEDEEQKNLYEAQCAVAKNLKNLEESAKLIPLLYPFCQGDYLQSILAVLYKTLYRISEVQAASFINVLMERGVSTRKHAVFLSFEVLPQKSALDIFKTVATKETNISAKKYLFQGILKYFLKNPEKYFLDLVFTSMSFIDKNDNELLQVLADSIETIPIKFRPIFFEHTWDFIGVMEKQEVKVLDYRSSLLSAVNTYKLDFFLSLKDSFCQNLIKQCFFSNDFSIMERGQIFPFVAKYLLAYNNDEHFKFIFNIIQTFKDLHWDSYDKKKLNYIFDFFQNIFGIFVENDITFLSNFKNHWEQNFKPEESFLEYVLLQLTMLYKKNPNIDQFSKEVNKTLTELITEYGPYINVLLLESVKTFITNSDINIEGFSNQFALHLLKAETSDINCFIALGLIDEKKKEVVDILKSVNRASVRIQCHNLLKRY